MIAAKQAGVMLADNHSRKNYENKNLLTITLSSS
jgi:hypothetical protein